LTVSSRKTSEQVGNTTTLQDELCSELLHRLRRSPWRDPATWIGIGSVVTAVVGVAVAINLREWRNYELAKEIARLEAQQDLANIGRKEAENKLLEASGERLRLEQSNRLLAKDVAELRSKQIEISETLTRSERNLAVLNTQHDEKRRQLEFAEVLLRQNRSLLDRLAVVATHTPESDTTNTALKQIVDDIRFISDGHNAPIVLASPADYRELLPMLHNQDATPYFEVLTAMNPDSFALDYEYQGGPVRRDVAAFLHVSDYRARDGWAFSSEDCRIVSIAYIDEVALFRVYSEINQTYLLLAAVRAFDEVSVRVVDSVAGEFLSASTSCPECHPLVYLPSPLGRLYGTGKTTWLEPVDVEQALEECVWIRRADVEYAIRAWPSLRR
jgi:hypothetical protein